jgi:hypothetical protein
VHLFRRRPRGAGALRQIQSIRILGFTGEYRDKRIASNDGLFQGAASLAQL